MAESGQIIYILFVIGTFGLVLAVISSLAITIEKRMRWGGSVRAVDELFCELWNGKKADKLLTWYEVRNRVMGDRRINAVQRKKRLDVVQARIEECKIRHSLFRTRAKQDGRTIIIHTQN